MCSPLNPSRSRTQIDIGLDLLWKVLVPQLLASKVLGCLLTRLFTHVREQSSHAAGSRRRGSLLDTLGEWLQGFRVVAQILFFLQMVLAFGRGDLEVLVNELDELVLALGGLDVARAIIHDAGDDMLLDIVVPRFEGGFAASSADLLLCMLDEQAGNFSDGVEGFDAGGAEYGDGGWSQADTGQGCKIQGVVDFHCGV